MLQGYIALPAVFAVYLYAARHRPGEADRATWLLAAVALAVSSFWWAAAVSLVPADERPYIGGSTDGTAWNLIMGYNGLGRIFGGEGNGGGGGGGGGGFSGTAGLGRMFNDILGGQISWLIPFAAIALVGGLVLCGRAPRTDVTRAALVMWGGWTALHYLTFAIAEGTMHPYYTTALAPGIAALCGGGGVLLLRAFRADKRWVWVLPAGARRHGASGRSSCCAGPPAGTPGCGRRSRWSWRSAIVGLLVFRSGNRVRLLAASVVAAIVASVAGPAAYACVGALRHGAAAWAARTRRPGPRRGAAMGGFGGGGGGESTRCGGGPGRAGGRSAAGRRAVRDAAAGATASARRPERVRPQSGGRPERHRRHGRHRSRRRPGGGMGGGMGGGGMGGGASSELISYLKKNQDGAKWLLAVSSSQSAAQLILSSGEPVISMWGWSGSDQAMTLAKLKELVKAGELHYIQLGGGMGGGPGGDSSLSSEVTAWVQENGTAVDASEYGGSRDARPRQ